MLKLELLTFLFFIQKILRIQENTVGHKGLRGVVLCFIVMSERTNMKWTYVIFQFV